MLPFHDSSGSLASLYGKFPLILRIFEFSFVLKNHIKDKLLFHPTITSPSLSMKIGVIFDWNGVIFDSSQYDKRSWEMLAAECGLELAPGYLGKSFGRSNRFIISKILNWSSEPQRINELSERKTAILRQIFAQEMAEPQPGIRALLQSLKDNGIPCAIACPAFREEVTWLLELLDLKTYFPVVIAHGNVQTPVSESEAFLLAAKSIDCSVPECIAIQSTIAGIEAARSVGIKTIAVATLNPKALLERARADAVFDSIRDLNLSTVAALRSLQK